MKSLIVLVLLSVTMWAHSTILSWQAPTSPVQIAGYRIYRSTISGSSYSLISIGLVSNLNFKDTIVKNGTTYYYVVRSVSIYGDESRNSNQVTAKIPTTPGSVTTLKVQVVKYNSRDSIWPHCS